MTMTHPTTRGALRATLLAALLTLGGAAPATAATIPFDLAALTQPPLAYDGAPHGASSNERVGEAMAGNCDLDGDGLDDVAAATSTATAGSTGRVPGAVYVLLGGAARSGGSLADPAAVGAIRIVGVLADDGGSPLALACAGDVDDDGVDDLAIGVQDQDKSGGGPTGAAWVVFGDPALEPGDTIDLTEPGHGYRIDGAAAGQRIGLTVTGVGDVDGDGRDDLAVSGADSSMYTGDVYVVAGKDDDTPVDLAAPGSSLLHVAGGDYSGVQAVAGPGDVDGDGTPDIVIGAYAYPGDTFAGTAYVLSGAATGEIGADELTAHDDLLFEISGGSGGLLAATSLVALGDVNGDGTPDIGVGEPLNPGGARVHVVFGSDAATPVDLTTPGERGFAIEAPAGAAALGDLRTIAGPGDVDGDGRDDVLLADPRADSSGADLHAAFLVYGKEDNDDVVLTDLTAAKGARLDGFAQDGPLTVAGAGDFDGNGDLDLAVGAPSQSSPGGAAEAGVVKVVRVGAAISVTNPPDGGGSPPPPVAPKPAPAKPKRPLVTGARKRQRVGPKGLVQIARLTCRGGVRCMVRVPKRVRVKIGGKKFRAKVLAPRSLRAGAKGRVRVKLPKRALERLVGRRAKVTVKITLISGDRKATRKISVNVGAPRNG